MADLLPLRITCPRSDRLWQARPRASRCCEGRASVTCPSCGTRLDLVTAGAYSALECRPPKSTGWDHEIECVGAGATVYPDLVGIRSEVH